MFVLECDQHLAVYRVGTALLKTHVSHFPSISSCTPGSLHFPVILRSLGHGYTHNTKEYYNFFREHNKIDIFRYSSIHYNAFLYHLINLDSFYIIHRDLFQNNTDQCDFTSGKRLIPFSILIILLRRLYYILC